MKTTQKLTTACCGPLTEGDPGELDAEDLARGFAALADPVRLRLLAIVISSGEVCSCNLEGPLDRSQPTISHHTTVLADAGLIVGERRGRWTYWRAVPERVEQLSALLSTNS